MTGEAGEEVRSGAAVPAAALLLLACAVAFFVGTDRPGLIEKDEPRYSVTARQMARGGDWLVPRYNGRERLVKPPGTYWAVAAAFRATGSFDERSARLPSAVAATLVVLLTAWGAGRAMGRRWGIAAGVVLATMLQFLVQGRIATTDMLFTLFFTGAAAAWVPVLEGSARAGPWILLSGLMAGLAGLVKTPLAILLPPVAAVAAAYLLARRGGPGALPAPFRTGNRGRTALLLLGAAAVFAAVYAAWVVPADRATEGRLWRALMDELSARVDADRDVHTESTWYFVGVVAAGALPWTFLLPAGVAAAWRRTREGGRGAVLPAFALALAALVFAFFSALPSKLASYVLPLYPALAVLAAAGAREMAEGPDGPVARWGRRAAGGGALLVALLLLGAAFFPAMGAPVVRDAVGDAMPALLVGASFLGVAALAARWNWVPALLASSALFSLSLVFTARPLLPRLEAARCARGLVRAMEEKGMRPGDRFVDMTNSVTGVLWYADRTSETRPDGTTPEEERVVEALASPDRTWALLGHEPAEDHARGRRTRWERVLARTTPGSRPPRVVWTGWGRVLVTNR